jgi:D-sedoheptulose 7-phosphate isomerase
MGEPTRLEQSVDALRAVLDGLAGLQGPMDAAAQLVGDCLVGGGKLLACGNGGSAADASHLTAELACRFCDDREPYAALTLGDSPATATATGNDYGFDQLFARQVRAFGRPGDVLVAITTSGNSANVLEAIGEAKRRGLHTVALLGRDGGKAAGLADVELIVRSGSTARVQEAHGVLIHVLCEMIEPRLTAGA